MPIVHGQVVFQSKTHLPADEVVNTWTFNAQTGTAEALAAAADPLVTHFYATGGHAIVVYMSPEIDYSLCQTKWYNLSETSATTPDTHSPGVGFGSPILVSPWVPADPGGTALPSQISCCLSIHGNHAGLAEHSGHGPRPAARLRGRIYIGPLSEAASFPSTTSQAAGVKGSFQTDLVAQANTVLAAGGPGAAPCWVVWSRKSNTVARVIGGFVDDRFDTQRRRAEKASGRVLFGTA